MEGMISKKVLQKLVSHMTYYWVRFRWDREIPLALYYHRVIEFDDQGEYEPSNPLICINKDLFEAQIRYLSANTNVVTLNDFVKGYSGQKSLPKNSILITFDDGYLDNFQNAFPILKKYRVPATIFLTTNRIGAQDLFWWDVLYAMIMRAESLDPFREAATALNWNDLLGKENSQRYRNGQKPLKERLFTALTLRLQRMRQEDIDLLLGTLKETTGIKESNVVRDFLSWEEIREMSNHGISFGSHSSTHANLSLLSEKELLRELRVSKEKIEEKTGIPVEALSYPYGIYDEKCEKAAEKSGYKVAFTTKRRNVSWDRFSIPRTPIKEGRSLGLLGNFSKHLFEVEYHGFHERMNSKLAFLTNNRLGIS